ncbi:3' tRNA processing endoribonuclease, variant 2 [Coprinopsis cinerea AmutBmut pab1-1]|nr:3' tRNA processing endoribonuclease, variant 2 [Coprinopsis cinerea AmutBmut pab1-1]
MHWSCAGATHFLPSFVPVTRSQSANPTNFARVTIQSFTFLSNNQTKLAFRWPSALFNRPIRLRSCTSLSRRFFTSTPPAMKKQAAASSTVMNWSASIQTTLSADSEPSLMIAFDNAKYMFNAGENTIGWGCCFWFGGTGLLMTLADASAVNEMKIAGPTGLTHFLASMRFYTFRDNLAVSPLEIAPPPEHPKDPEPVFQDENITVYALPLTPDDVSSPSAQSEDSSLKRKRETSPDQPRKRSTTSVEDEASHLSAEQRSLTELMADSSFKPQSLTGENAAEYRRLLVQTMFPADVAKVQQSEKKGQGEAMKVQGHGKTKKQRKAEEAAATAASAISAKDAIKRRSPSPAPFPVDKDAQKFDDYRRTPRHLPKGYHTQLPSLPPNFQRTPIGYVIIGPRIRGRFDVARATALGVPRGPLRGLLTKGETVTFQVEETFTNVQGQQETRMKDVTVKPEQCVGESEAPSAVVVLDVPEKRYLGSLEKWFAEGVIGRVRSRKEEDEKEYSVKAVFHMLGEGVLEDPRYIEFMNGFRDGVDHLVTSKEHCPNRVTFTSATFNQLRLNKLDNEMFPIQKFNLEPSKSLSSIPNLPKNTQLMRPNVRIGVRPYAPPKLDPQTEGKDLFHPLVEGKKLGEGESIEVQLPEETVEKFEQAREAVKKIAEGAAKPVERPGDDVVVVPLGTGSAVPGRYRTVSSTLIQIPNWGNILLDAGEGTYYQLARHFGEEGVKEVLRDLKCLYVSHVHGDHHMGVPMILRKRLELDPPPENPLYLVSIRIVQLYLQEVQQLYDLGIRPSINTIEGAGNAVIPIQSEALHYARPGEYASGYWAVNGTEPWLDPKRSVTLARSMCEALGLRSFSTVDMRHGTRCYGLVVKHRDGWSIAFSGDTEPTDSIVHAGRNATLLIHEATMSDDQVELARQKKHSTFGQAIGIGRRMNARTILLTHFSARHPKIPMSVMDISSDPTTPTTTRQGFHKTEPTIALAFDQSCLRIGDMWKMKHYLPALEQNEKDTVAIDGEDEGVEGAMDLDPSA